MLAGGPLADGPLAASPRIFVASFTANSPAVGGGGAITATITRRQTVPAAVAGGTRLVATGQRRHVLAAAIIAGGRTLGGTVRSQAAQAAIRGGGAIFAPATSNRVDLFTVNVPAGRILTIMPQRPVK